MRLALTGQRFGKLTVLSCPGGGVLTARCDCGTEKEFKVSNVYRGISRSCGCGIADAARMRTKHGESVNGKRSPELRTWKAMKRRCHCPSAPDYPRYGGKGIRVCDRWRESFSNFLADMGRRPSELHSIDRINNDGNYEPGNCRWATAEVQAANRRFTIRVLVDGRDVCLAEACRIMGLAYQTIRQRIVRYGYSVEEAFSRRIRGSK